MLTPCPLFSPKMGPSSGREFDHGCGQQIGWGPLIDLDFVSKLIHKEGLIIRTLVLPMFQQNHKTSNILKKEDPEGTFLDRSPKGMDQESTYQKSPKINAHKL